MEPLVLSKGRVVPADELRVEFARAGGPGGQKVNRTASKVVLRFAPLVSGAFDERERARLERALARRLTKAGELVLHASRHREQARNLDDARERLAELLERALAPPPPPRKKTRPSRGARERRLKEKKRRGEVKRERRPPE